MRKIQLAVCLAALVAMPAGLQAQVSVGGQGSWADDADFGIGARAALGVPVSGQSLQVMGSFDYFFPGNDLTYWEINGNVAYMFPIPGSPVAPYAGAGLNFAHASVSTTILGQPVEASNSEMGLNVLGGAQFKAGNLTPFAELRVELSGGEQFVLAGGVMISVGPGMAAGK